MRGLFEVCHDTDFERPRSKMTETQRLSDLQSTREDISMSDAEELTRDSLIREIAEYRVYVDAAPVFSDIAVQSTRQR
jgi:hypothetical protein